MQLVEIFGKLVIFCSVFTRAVLERDVGIVECHKSCKLVIYVVI